LASATAPVSALSTQIGALVKLVRVLTLGPVLFGVWLLERVLSRRETAAPTAALPSFKRLAPWFHHRLSGACRAALDGFDSGRRPARHPARDRHPDGAAKLLACQRLKTA
jgi:hypothetical protein